MNYNKKIDKRDNLFVMMFLKYFAVLNLRLGSRKL